MMDKFLRVIQVVPGVGTEASGPSYSVPGLCRGLIQQGAKVSLFASGNVPINIKGCDIHSFKSHVIPLIRRGISRHFYEDLLKSAAEVDILHSNGLWSMYNVYPGWVIEKYRKSHKGIPKFVISPRGTLSNWSLHKGRVLKVVLGACLQYPSIRRADMFHATSEKEYEEIRALGYKQPIAIVPIGMDIPKGKCSVDKNDANRLRRIVFFGRIHKVKAVDNLVRAWGDLHLDLSNWELVIAGPDCGAKGKLEEIIKELDIPRVRFTGELNGQAKYDFLADADIYVLPSHTENFGVTVAEALASGVPTIASQGTPWKGLEVEGCGRWVPIGVTPLVEALRALTSLSDQERTAMGEKGIEWIRRDFSWNGIGAKMKLAYEWLLGLGDRPAWVRVD